jgi:arylsulfatase
MSTLDGALSLSRRAFLNAMAVGAVTVGANPGGGGVSEAARPAAVPGPYNILFILTDQERYFRPGELPAGYRLPAHEALTRRGVTFDNHRINSCVCTPSRSVLYTGQHIQQTRMFDNANFPWVSSMSTDIRTVGHLLREAGYYTAYKGKWHLAKEFEHTNKLGAPEKIFTKEMQAYGFADYFGIGDIIAHTRGGYEHDGIISAMAVTWLRSKGKDLAAAGKPWFLAVNLVNPHDVMFYDTDPIGQIVQGKHVLADIARDPSDPLYAKQWTFALPRSHPERLDAPGRPRAHAEYLRSHDVMVGPIPDEVGRWRRRHNYYLNCLRDVDRNIVPLLEELDGLGLGSRTIVVLTADHGDLDGAHRLHGKGATAYREQNQVPLIIAHPAYGGSKRCQAVTAHVDIAPTLVGLTDVPPEKKAAIVNGLPGWDFSSLLVQPERASHQAVRAGVLVNYNMLAYVDGQFAERVVAYLRQGGAKDILKDAGIRPDLTKRGAIRSVFDGRYQFSRYFSPRQHNRPTSIEDLFRFNDVELFDLRADPDEVQNLALNRAKHGGLIVAMNDKLNRLIDREVGEDVGQMLPGGIDGGWAITPENVDP